MIIVKIMDWRNENVLLEVETEDGTLNGVDLSGKVLNFARLDGARLDGARLDGARLDGARLDGASLVNASLDGARLDGARLVNARLVNASLVNASLVNASLDGARLDGARLDGARLVNASLDGATLATINPAQLSQFKICPEEGAFIGWKKVRGGVVLKLEILADAQRMNALSARKCRASAVLVLEAMGTEETEFYGLHDSNFVYRVGEVATPDSFDFSLTDVCSHGIHFFMTRAEAEAYDH